MDQKNGYSGNASYADDPYLGEYCSKPNYFKTAFDNVAIYELNSRYGVFLLI